MVSHSHDDVGWLDTPEDYYNREVRGIYNAVLSELAKDANRKFVVSEIYFVSKWWSEIGEESRATFRSLLESGQISFVNGGWVSNDEACPLFSDMIDQMALGAETISGLFGLDALPTVGWQLDSFGHSRFQADLFALSGYSAYFLGRIDYQDQNQRIKRHDLETMYRGIFAATMYHYTPPTGFHFGWKNDELITEANINRRLDAFAGEVVKKFHEFHGPNATAGDVLVTMGDDFAYGPNEVKIIFLTTKHIIVFCKRY